MIWQRAKKRIEIDDQDKAWVFMQLYLENETEVSFDFYVEVVAGDVINAVLEVEACPYEIEVNLLLTDNDGIQEYNREMRGIDRPTDVLSFPGLFFEEPSVFFY